MKKTALTALAISLLILIGCGASQRPVLYPNAHLKSVGEDRARRDVDECMQMAEGYVKKHQDSKVPEGAVKGGAVGGAAGAAGGAVAGNIGRGAGIGAAAGAAAGATRGAFKAGEPSPVFKQFVNRCLREKGYDPIGWE